MKTCSKCRESKHLTEFHRDARRSDGRQRYCKACVREWAREHPENRRENARRDRARNPHVGWTTTYRDRIKKYGHEPVVERFTKHDVVSTYGAACFYCGGPFEELDHVVPVRDGGAHVLGNVRPSCAPCNRGRRDYATPTHPTQQKGNGNERYLRVLGH